MHHASHLQYFPLAAPFLLVLFLILIVVIALIELRLLRYAYEKLGISRQYVYALMLLSLLGSYINIPVAELPPERVVSNQIVTFFGVPYVVPEVQEWPGTIVAVNVGGGLVPTLLSIYLLLKNRLFLRGLAGVVIVAAVVHWFARPVRGVGISVPTIIPPLVAVAVGLLLSWEFPAPLAYIAGSLGTLVGADLLNLGRVQGLGAPVASIGGAGTFDGIFLSGILAVLLTPMGRRRPDAEWAAERPVVPPEAGSEDVRTPVFP